MRIASVIARYLLGLMFTVSGLNGFLHFIPQPPPANPLAIQFLASAGASNFAAFFFAVQVLGGLLLLPGFFVPLAPGAAPAVVACSLWVLVFLEYRDSFNGIFTAEPATQA